MIPGPILRACEELVLDQNWRYSGGSATSFHRGMLQGHGTEIGCRN